MVRELTEQTEMLNGSWDYRENLAERESHMKAIQEASHKEPR